MLNAREGPSAIILSARSLISSSPPPPTYLIPRLPFSQKGNLQYGTKSLMKLRLYVLKSVHPNGVPSGTANPVVPAPVKDALRFGATVKVDVYALSPVPATCLQMILTVFAD